MEPLLAFSCPRCTTAVEERFYGLCAECRTQLRGSQRIAARAVATERFEPKMNVVPNQVASKD